VPHYKDTSGNLHFLDDAAFAHLLPAGCVEISADKAQVMAPVPVAIPEPGPTDKLRAFLAANPDVAALIK
jgi:hypothetical protein